MEDNLRKYLEKIGLDKDATDSEAWKFYANLEGDQRVEAKAINDGDDTEGDSDDDSQPDIAAIVKAAVADATKGLKAQAKQNKAHAPEPQGKAAQPWVTAVRRSGRVKNFKGNIGGRDAEERAYRFGTWALDAISRSIPALSDAFPQAKQFVADQGLRTKLHQGNVNTTGGYAVPDEFGTDLIDLREEYGVARQVLRIRPMSSDTRTDPRRVSGLTAYFVAEGAAGTESTKGWDQVRLTAKDLMVLSRMTNQLSDDAVINIGDDLAGEIAYAFAEKEDQCAFNGDGTSTYGGIVGIRAKLQDVDGAGTDSAGLKTASGNAFSEITLPDFNSVVGALPQYADTPNAAWLMHKTFYHEVVEKLILASGGVPATEVREGQRRPRPLFLGYPVIISQVFPSTESNSSVVCTLGDHTLAASFGDRQQDAIAFSEHASVGGESVFERNEIAIRGTERFDINVHDVGDASNAGPVVGLQTANS